MKNARDLKHDTDLIIRQIEEKPYDELKLKVENLLYNAAKEGNYNVTIPCSWFDSCTDEQEERLVKVLEKNGYEVFLILDDGYFVDWSSAK